MAESEVFSMLLGSLVNAAAILAGSAVGLLLRFFLRRSSRRSANSPAREYPPMIYVLSLSVQYFMTSAKVPAAPSPKSSLPKTAGARHGDRSKFQFETFIAIR